MRETGVILNLDNNMAKVRAGEIASCFGCMSQECKSNNRIYQAENRSRLDLSAGDYVEIENKVQNSILQACSVLMPPLLGFIGVFMLVKHLVPGSDESMQAAFGSLASILSFFIVYWVRKLLPSRTAPIILRKLESNEITALSDCTTASIHL